MDNVRSKASSISDQALLLIDDFHSSRSRKKNDLFSDIEQHVTASLQSGSTPTQQTQTSLSNPFTVAARLGRPNYEEQAKSEALHSALQKLRARSTASNIGATSSGRVLRSR